MATPITWQNVNGPSLSEASRPLDSAARAFDMGFGALRDTMRQREAIDTQNFQTGRDNNTNAFLDRLSQYRTVDELKAAQSSGALDALRASFGPQINAEQVRGAFDQRLNGLMTQQKQGIEFNNFMTDQNEAPLRDKYRQAVLAKDDVTKQKIREANPNMRNMYELMEYGLQQERGFTQDARGADIHKWAGVTHDRQGVMQDAQIGNMTHGQRMAEGNLKVNQRQAAVQEANAVAAQAERLEVRLDKFRKEKADTFRGQASSTEGQASIQDFIKGLEDPNDRKQARLAASRALKENPNATTASVLQGVGGMNTRWWSLDSMDRQGVVNDIAEATNSGRGSAEIENARQRRDDVDLRMNATKDRLNLLARGSNSAPAGNGNASTQVANPIGMPAAARQKFIQPGSSEEQQIMQDLEERVQAKYGTPPPPPDYAALEAAKKGDFTGRIPSKPREKVWVGNKHLTNPAYAEWEKQYGAAARKRSNEENRRMILNLERIRD